MSDDLGAAFIVHRSSLIAPRSSLHPLKHLIVLPIHPQAPVDLLRGGVAAVDVETDSLHTLVDLGELRSEPVEPRVDAAPSELRADVDALDPPHHAIAPVAPLRRDHQTPHQLAAVVRHEIPAEAAILEDRFDAARADVQVEL